jgi:hypothetical protein
MLAALLALALLYLASVPHLLAGDAQEYTLMTIAVASHGTPEIRSSDIAAARPLMPAFGPSLDQLERDMAEPGGMPAGVFLRAPNSGQVQAIHFPAYSALAALPFKLLQLGGLPPLKCFQVVNLGFLLVLGMVLLRHFHSVTRALAALALFLLCGGMLYMNWSSPETMTAAALLSALLLYTGGAPVAGGVLAGLAALQNPTVVFFFGFAPLLRLLLAYRRARGLAAALRATLQARDLAGLAIGLALLALFPLFNWWQFGVPSIIAKVATDTTLIGAERLHSFYFDPNQGMLVGVPALALLLAALALAGRGQAAPYERPRRLLVLLACCALTLALALPTLAVHNWNSGAAGVMRYAFWAAIPLLFVLLWQLRRPGPWPRALMAGLMLAQALAMYNAGRYSHVEYSPLARWMLLHAAPWYNPEPEIFIERSNGNEVRMDPKASYRYPLTGEPLKTMYHRANLDIGAQLCGPGRDLVPTQAHTDSSRMWRYVDGPLQCDTAGVSSVRYALPHFQAAGAIKLGAGWSTPQAGGGEWDGVWSDAPHAHLTLTPQAGRKLSGMLVVGRYYDGNTQTRITINGKDLGWQRLQDLPLLPLPQTAQVEVEFEFDHPLQPPASQPDKRQLGIFLQQIAIQ